MTIKQAVAQRFRAICQARGINPNELANNAGVTSSSVYNMLDDKRENVSIVLIKQLCDGLEMPLHDFFNDSLFWSLEQEIK